MTLTDEVHQLTTVVNTLNTTVTDFMQTVIDTSDNDDQSRAAILDALMKRTQTLHNTSLQDILDNHKKEMVTVMQQNTQNIKTIAATITRDVTSLLQARFPLNTPPVFGGFDGNNGNNVNHGHPGMPGSSGSGGGNGLKIDIATSYFKGEANSWFRWVQNKLTNPSWIDFCTLQGSVRDHIKEFEQLINFVTDLPDDYVIDLFIRPLKKDIRSIIEVFEPPTLVAAFRKAIKQEDVLLSNSSFYKSVARSNLYIQSSTSSDQANAPFKKPTIPSGVKRLSLEEQRHRREQGLCCDEQYKDGHICAKQLNSILLILEMTPEIHIEGEKEPTTSDTEEMITPAAANQMHYEPKISLHAFTGSSFPTTMRVTGYIAGQPITILLDSGSTHNLLHPTIAKRCGVLPKSVNDDMNVLVGNGGILKTQGLCSDISLKLQDYQFTTEFFLLELSGCEAVLGVAWLRTLGNISWDFEKLHMKFTSDDQEYALVVSDLLLRFSDLFTSPTDLPPQKKYDHRIPLLPNSTPVNVRPYRYPYFQKEDIEKIVKELIDTALNKVTVKDRFPIVDELLDELHGAVIFSKIDMRSGYHQIRVHPDDIHKTAFCTNDGHYKFLVMPFGLSNAPATFQSLMNEILRPFLRKFVLVFFDDILIYIESESEHIQHVNLVFEALRAHQIFLNQQKCEFAKKTISYLGHMVSSEGVSVDSDKISCITNCPIPTTVKALRGFLGLAGYYRKFVKDYSKISAPLTQLLKLDSFVWTPDATTAFNNLKKALTSTPVLALPDFTKEFSLECDASVNGLGAVLIQDKRNVAYYNKSLSGKNLNLSVYDKEMLDIVNAVNK
ncbi:uncharacterized protein LOC113359994 [Papaver somniferum]|uniref:uncharacterized protein LOC113359994 n=1 Tax=Papaver somniferum TaxID=3469 RepID=UPI000E6FA6DC|nr:uncharacterized protein LOC113359994 [Papaver somniferum]